MQDPVFLIDLFNFVTRYSDNVGARTILQDLVKVYFEEGSAGVRRYKATQPLALNQVPTALRLLLRDNQKVWAELKTQRTEANTALSPFEARFATTFQNYDTHRQERQFKPDQLDDTAINALTTIEAELAQLAQRSQNTELKNAIEARDIETIKRIKPSGKDKPLPAQAIGLLKRWSSLQENDIVIVSQAMDLIERIRALSTVEHKAQSDAIQNLSNEVGDSIDRLVPRLGRIKSGLDVKQKPEAQIIGEMIGLLTELRKGGTLTVDSEPVSAEISFDLKETLKIGRYGASGQGNCQNSTQSGEVNQSLMSFIGDAHELIMLFRDAQNTVIGFALLHGVFTETGDFIYIQDDVYTNDTHRAAQQEAAAIELARMIQKKLGVEVKRLSKKAESETINIPKSRVLRYYDALKETVPTSSVSRTLRLESVAASVLSLIVTGAVIYAALHAADVKTLTAGDFGLSNLVMGLFVGLFNRLRPGWQKKTRVAAEAALPAIQNREGQRSDGFRIPPSGVDGEQAARLHEGQPFYIDPPTRQQVLEDIQTALKKLGHPELRVVLYGHFADETQHQRSTLNYFYLPGIRPGQDTPSLDLRFQQALPYYRFEMQNPSTWLTDADVQSAFHDRLQDIYDTHQQKVIFVIGADGVAQITLQHDGVWVPLETVLDLLQPGHLNLQMQRSAAPAASETAASMPVWPDARGVYIQVDDGKTTTSFSFPLPANATVHDIADILKRRSHIDIGHHAKIMVDDVLVTNDAAPINPGASVHIALSDLDSPSSPLVKVAGLVFTSLLSLGVTAGWVYVSMHAAAPQSLELNGGWATLLVGIILGLTNRLRPGWMLAVTSRWATGHNSPNVPEYPAHIRNLLHSA